MALALVWVTLVGLATTRAAHADGADAGAVTYVTADMKELYWRELAVEARLDAEGQLHVTETHQMVFTGLWNGGERSFRVGNGQGFELRSLTRVDADGRRSRVVEGSLARLDEYELTDDYVLRWRSRRASDAIFDHTQIGYEIDYVLSDILVPMADGRFLLDHEFSVLNRIGDIQHFRLHLELDRVWHGDRPSPIDVEAASLHPSEGFALKLPLESRGAAYPPSAWKRAARKLRSADGLNLVLAALLPAVVLYWVRRRLRADRERGLFEPVPDASQMDRTWLMEQVLSLKPELISAAYYGRVGRPQVAALFARLEQEGKIRLTTPYGKSAASDFELELLVNRRQLVGYERELVNSLMPTGTRTNGAAMQERYSDSGFSPADSLRKPLSAELAQLLGPGHHGAAQTERLMLLGMLTLSAAMFGAMWLGQSLGVYRPLGCVFVSGVFYLFGIRFAARVHGEVEAPEKPLRWHLMWIGGWTLLAVGILLFLQPSKLVAGLTFILGLWVVRTMLRVSTPPGNRTGINLQKRLAGVRQYFALELKKPEPSIDDAWFPHLVGLGLSPMVSQWVADFAGGAMRRVERSSSDSSEASTGSAAETRAEAPRWTGGGGFFGGAGATGSWLSAAESLATGVSGQSSGSSSSDSGSSSSSAGSSSSSGGGGGGGW